MADLPDPQPISLTQYTVLVVQEWPARIRVSQELLQSPHLRGAAYDPQAGTLTFTVYNGGATYQIEQQILPGDRGPWTASLVDGTAEATDRRP